VELRSRPRSWHHQEKKRFKITFKGYTVHASKDQPQYQIKSDKSDYLAMHKGSALKKIRTRKSSSA